MAKSIVNITEANLLEWMHSVGYFLPRTDKELQRFETIHVNITHSLSASDVNPLNIVTVLGKLEPSSLKKIPF